MPPTSRTSLLRILCLATLCVLTPAVGFLIGHAAVRSHQPPPPRTSPAPQSVMSVLEPAPAPPRGLPPGPHWSRSRFFLPEGANVVFSTADGCALCHSVSPSALAMQGENGEDLSPWGTWRGTLMAQSYVDPYWRAAVAQAVAAAPGDQPEIEALCLRCHGPMASHTARIAGAPSPSLDEADGDALAYDGVSCSVCHQVQPEGLGDRESFSGRLDIRPGRRIFGPYPEPVATPMVTESLFTPEHGPHMSDSALCGSCHTLETRPGEDAPHFLEQAPYLEWRNSVYAGAGDEARSCQQCHMQSVGETAIARSPGGSDYSLLARDDVRSHAIVGGNAFMLRMLRENRDELLVDASAEHLERTERATREFLGGKTATVTIEGLARTATGLSFAVRLVNRTGHKFPTGYPSRRAWLRVVVTAGERVVFESGGFDERGRLAQDRLGRAHVREVTTASDVPIYETVAADLAGEPTVVLTRMATTLKDTRLLPRGWRSDGPHGDETAPIGVAGDDDFTGGGDTVWYRLPLDVEGPLAVRAVLHYQPIPPLWVEPLRKVDADAARTFVRLYDAADPRPEVVAETTATVE
jgi:hypothetical protein